MKNYLKKFCVYILVLQILSVTSVTVLATAEATVFANSLSVSSEKTIVPVNISSENEIMGFKISVSYPYEQIEITGVSRGSVTAKGNFNTNFGITDGKFDIIWNNTSPISADGTLFAITVDTSRVVKDTQIEISFSQPDTFDGEYKDVFLKCENIKVFAEPIEIEPSTESQTKTENESIATKVDFDSSQVVDSVNNVLDKENLETIYDVEDKEAFLEDVNVNLQTILGTDQIFYMDFESVLSVYESYYKESFVSDVLLNLDSAEIQVIINAALEEVNSDSIDEIKNIDKFNKAVEEKIKEKIFDREAISEHVTEDVVFEAIKQIHSVSFQTNSVLNNKKNEPEKKTSIGENYKYIIVLGYITVIILIGLLIVLRIKRKRK